MKLLLLLLPVLSYGATVDFNDQIHPILASRCFSCHSGDKRFGGLSLSNYSELMRGGTTGKVVNPGDPSTSTLYRRIAADGVPPMPPAGPRLTANEIGTIETWIKEGARPAKDAAAAKPIWRPKMALSTPTLPEGPEKHPVDRWVGDYFRSRNQAKPQPVSDALYARRVYLDVWGLLPTPEQSDQFLKSRNRTALAASLLKNSHNYAEHWMTWWNDILRNDEGVNYAGTRKSITPWLSEALERNMPYNRFAAKLLNPVEKTDPEGFLIGVNWRGDVNASQTPTMQAAQNTAQIFMGVNLKCNSCHDSFVSRWKLKEAYDLASYFADERLEIVRCDAKTGKYAEPRFLFPELGGNVGADATLPERRKAAAELFTKAENGRFARTIVNRVWKRLLGHGLVEPVDDMDAEPWHPQLLDWLASDFAEHGYDVKHLIGRIVTSEAYQYPSVESGAGEYAFRGPEKRRVTAEQFVDAVSSITGEWRVKVTPKGLTAEPVREWRLASSPLTRALGRPIRDQVFTERNQQATTLQALEMVNGETYTRLLRRASRKMLGELPPPPANLFDSGRVSAESVKVDIDVRGLKQIRLMVVDVDSYSPERVKAVWAGAKFVKKSGPVDLEGQTGAGKMKSEEFTSALRVKVPSEVVLDLAGKGYQRFQATVGVENESHESDISPRIRFFVFKEAPDPERLVRVAGDLPVAAPRGPFTVESLTERVYRHALGRAPNDQERQVARELLAGADGKPNSEGLADLLWAITMLPEFQLL